MVDFVLPKFDGECDVAAMVYGLAEDPDAILEDFVRRLMRRGFDAVGVVQRRSASDRSGRGTPEFLILPDDERPRPSSDAGDAPGAVIAGVNATLSAALRRRPDALVLNRFGSLETRGGGLLDVLAQAIARDVPVAIAVPEALFANWLRLAEGLAVRVRPDARSLEAWWRSLAKSPPATLARETFCERYK